MNKMKHFAALLLLLSVCMVSCQKEQKEWSKLYGYSQDDIVGRYTYSQLPEAFSGLMESEEAHLCADAQVSITSASEQNIVFSLSCPDHGFQRSFSGRPTLNANAFLIGMGGGWVGLKRYALSATVLKNTQDAVRLDGFVSEDHYEKVFNTEEDKYDTLFTYSVKYYFDVIKN